MVNDLKRLFHIGELTSAQREAVIQAARDVTSPEQDALLVQYIDKALAEEAAVRDLEERYEASKSSKAEYPPELPKLDQRVDRQVSAVFRGIENAAEAEHDDSTIPAKAEMLLEKAFPNGVRAITGLPYPEQNRSLKDLMSKLRGDELSPLVSAVGITGKVNALGKMAADYDALVMSSPAAVAYSTLEQARQQAELRLHEILARVIGMSFDSSVPGALERRGKVLNVLFQELETAAARRRTRKAASRRRREAEGETNADGQNPTTPSQPPAAGTSQTARASAQPDGSAAEEPAKKPAKASSAKAKKSK